MYLWGQGVEKRERARGSYSIPIVILNLAIAAGALSISLYGQSANGAPSARYFDARAPRTCGFKLGRARKGGSIVRR